jgi:polyhydroxybutyrate depolymerase
VLQGPAGETCAQATDPAGNTENYGTVDLSYQSCMDLEGSARSGSYCNCCSCADDLGFVREILQQLQTEHCVDRRRVYATGMSYGGLFSYQVALSMPHVFAAVAPVAGGILRGFATPPSGPVTGGYIGVLDIHGWFDPWVPANDTHSGMSGAGYDWPDGSEDEDSIAQSNDGWYYTPVDQLMQLFARYNGCDTSSWTNSDSLQEVAGELSWPRRETDWDGNNNLYCVSTDDDTCNGPGKGVRVMRCSWEGGHSWPSDCSSRRGCSGVPWGSELVWQFLAQHAREDII